MTGLPPFLLEKNDTFQTSFKKLIKSYKSKSQQQDFIRFISNQIESLIINPYPAQSRTEPLPGGIRLPDNLQFYKLVIVVAKGASGQIRLMYLVDKELRVIKLLLIYNHEQFPKRPADSDLRNVLRLALEDD